MGAQLFALCIEGGSGRDFRATQQMRTLPQLGRAEDALSERWGEWLTADLIPIEPIPLGNKTAEPRRYGMDRWHQALRTLDSYLPC